MFFCYNGKYGHKSKFLTMLSYILNKTESNEVILKDAEIFFGSILLLMANESNTLKTKALSILNIFLNIVKNINYEMNENEQQNT
jgi:hypothetical protein